MVINIFFGRFEQKLAGFRALAQSFIKICQKLFHTRKNTIFRTYCEKIRPFELLVESLDNFQMSQND